MKRRCPAIGCDKRKDKFQSCKSYELATINFHVPLDPSKDVSFHHRVCQPCYKKYRPSSIAMLEETGQEELPQRTLSPLQPSQLTPHPPRPTPLPPLPSPPHPTPLPSTPLHLGSSPAPLISRPAVIHSLYHDTHSPHPGLSFWSLSVAEFPLTGSQHLRPPFYTNIKLTAATNYFMPVVPFNLPDHHKEKQGSASEHYQPSQLPASAAVAAATAAAGVLELVNELRNGGAKPAGKPLTVMYQKDNEAFSAWQDEWEWVTVEADGKISMRTEVTTATVHSPLNPHLFDIHHTNLLSIMRDSYTFAGFSSPSWYVKTPNSFFCLHVEQLFAPFYNHCYEGGTTWWVVQRESVPRLKQYVVKRARLWYGVREEVELSEAEMEAIHGFLYTKQLVFRPDDLCAAGVRLTEVQQEAGTVVVGDGDVVHFGTTTLGRATHDSQEKPITRSINEAVNALPVQWLMTGLPLLVEWLRWLQRWWLPLQLGSAMRGKKKAGLKAAVQHWRTNYLVWLHCSPHWCYPFLLALRSTIDVKRESDSPLYNVQVAVHEQLDVNENGRGTALGLIDEALTIMDDAKVSTWIGRYK